VHCIINGQSGGANGAIIVSYTQDEHGGMIEEISFADDVPVVEPLTISGNPGTHTAPTGHSYNPVIVSEVPERDVNFIDYDGRILYSYSAADFANLSALPANPTHEGLTAQGWNWNLANAKTHVATYGILDIGQSYTTTSGKTEVDIELTQYHLDPYMSLGVNGTAVIDWGDGTATTTVTGSNIATAVTNQHTYASGGKYTIKIQVSSGQACLIGTSNNGFFHANNTSSRHRNKMYGIAVLSVRLGSGMSLGAYALCDFLKLQSVSIPTSTTIGDHSFYYCKSLVAVVLPSGITSIGSHACYGAESLLYFSIPNSVTNINTYMLGQAGISRISLPGGITAIGDYTFTACEQITYLKLPASATTIGNSALYSMYSLSCVVLPSSLTQIGNNVFNSDYALAELHFTSATPPAAASSSTFTGLPTTCIIYVPQGKLNAYKTATNYPSASTYTYVEE